MNDKIKKCLRKRSKLTKFCYKHRPKKRGPRKTTSKICILHRGDIET